MAHPRILLKADAGPDGLAWSDDRGAEAVEVSPGTVGRGRQRFVEQGPDAAPSRERSDRPNRERAPGGRAEARLSALACSEPPDGRAVWAVHLLADPLVGLGVVAAVSDEAVRRAMKRTRSSRG